MAWPRPAVPHCGAVFRAFVATQPLDACQGTPPSATQLRRTELQKNHYLKTLFKEESPPTPNLDHFTTGLVVIPGSIHSSPLTVQRVMVPLYRETRGAATTELEVTSIKTHTPWNKHIKYTCSIITLLGRSYF